MKFRVDLSDVIAEFEMQAAAASAMTQQVVDDVTTAVLINWRSAAKRELNSTRNEYIRSIYMGEQSRFKNVLILRGTLPNMIEFGAQPFDLKEGFARSSKVKYTKSGGWYLTIPFRWSTPGSIGENSAFSNSMPQDVHQLARQLRPKTSTVGRSKAGESLASSSLPARHQTKGTRKAAANALTGQNFPAYQHKSPLLAGLQRNEQTYAKATQNTYSTFRRVSSNSDPNSWIHTGIKAHDLATKAFQATDFDTIVNNSVDRFLSSL
jgi:hypothetical protein